MEIHRRIACVYIFLFTCFFATNWSRLVNKEIIIKKSNYYLIVTHNTLIMNIFILFITDTSFLFLFFIYRNVSICTYIPLRTKVVWKYCFQIMHAVKKQKLGTMYEVLEVKILKQVAGNWHALQHVHAGIGKKDGRRHN